MALVDGVLELLLASFAVGGPALLLLVRQQLESAPLLLVVLLKQLDVSFAFKVTWVQKLNAGMHWRLLLVSCFVLNGAFAWVVDLAVSFNALGTIRDIVIEDSDNSSLIGVDIANDGGRDGILNGPKPSSLIEFFE